MFIAADVYFVFLLKSLWIIFSTSWTFDELSRLNRMHISKTVSQETRTISSLIREERWECEWETRGNNSKQYLISVTIMSVFIRNMKSDEIFTETNIQASKKKNFSWKVWSNNNNLSPRFISIVGIDSPRKCRDRVLLKFPKKK